MRSAVPVAFPLGVMRSSTAGDASGGVSKSVQLHQLSLAHLVTNGEMLEEATRWRDLDIDLDLCQPAGCNSRASAVTLKRLSETWSASVTSCRIRSGSYSALHRVPNLDLMIQ